ncbi:arylsulfatase [Pseudomonas sp. GD03860]|uniref:arylsulfatase n=1 Tax=Pseudomonas TaxID=286 RepID=UPI002363B466|nr:MULTISPECIES: arylsulfatase [Pseudomonas]MDD2058533.1 arylsulfatase [Pseudomonas putida]MDH0640715.1 arylsulfatase [Pseudomonas sp. GD03860]
MRLALAVGALLHLAGAVAAPPNILVIFGDDVGQTNISAYAFGVVGYKTPNLDRIAREGMMFTDYYAENSCTAGRSAFITGQSPLRTGLTKVGSPGAPIGLQQRDVTLARVLKSMGYATGQFGKNHLGDRNEFLPTQHGFDEFFGNLYHLNAEENPEHAYWPKDPNDPYAKKLRPRGVLHAFADGKIEDTGALNSKRMETIDDEITNATIDFITRQAKADKPFFAWMNTTRMHAYTHVRPSMQGQSGMPGNTYADGMIEHDGHVGQVLAALDNLKLSDNTIVVYTTDNGPNKRHWPDAATSPFRNEKNSNWEGAFRAPAMVRWPGKIPAGEVSTAMFAGLDWFPTLVAAVGNPDIKAQLLQGTRVGTQDYKVHLDGYNQLDLLTGKTSKSAREEFYYFSDDGELVAMRFDDWKAVFCEQRKPGGFEVWEEPFVCLRIPKIFNLRMDPFEEADIVSDQYDAWRTKAGYLAAIASMRAAKFLQTFMEYPPSQLPASFSIDQVRRQVDAKVVELLRQKAAQKP